MGDELAYSKMCRSHEKALRRHTIKCSMANAFLIRPGGLGCRLKRKRPEAQEAERAKEGGEGKRERERSGCDLHAAKDFTFTPRVTF